VPGDVPVVVNVDPRAQMVGEPKPVRRAQRIQVVDLVGRRFVVVGDAHLERQLGHSLHRFGRDPGDRGHRRFDTHFLHLRHYLRSRADRMSMVLARAVWGMPATRFRGARPLYRAPRPQ